MNIQNTTQINEVPPFTYNNKTIYFETITGEVIQYRTDSADFWLRLSDGREIHVQDPDAQVSVLSEHRVTILYYYFEKQKQKSLVAFMNHNSQDTIAFWKIEETIKSKRLPKTQLLFPLIYSILPFLFSSYVYNLGFWLTALIVIAINVYFHLRNKKERNKVKTLYCNHIKNALINIFNSQSHPTV